MNDFERAMRQVEAAVNMTPQDVESLRQRVLEGAVIERDVHRFPQAVVESLTEFDYVDLPLDLRDRLVEWCEDFRRWADQQ